MSGTMIPTICQILVCPIKFYKKNVKKNVICHFVFQNVHTAGYHEKMIGRTYFGGDQVTQLNLDLYNTINWPYQPKHSPSYST